MTSKLRRFFAPSALLLLAFATNACKPKVGDSCSQGDQACQDPSTGLFCGSDSKYAVMSCMADGKGNGCSGSGATFACDNSVANLGDGCSQVEDVACAPDRKSALQCGKDNKFALGETCKGPNGCTVKGDSITCDNDTADVGDPCHFPGDYACTSDKGLVLRCDDHKMTPLNTCRGPKHCRVFELPQEKKVQFDCDDSIAQDGDFCDTPNEQACSADKKSILTCKSGKFTSATPCPGPNGCAHDEKDDSYACDTGAATAAAPDPTAATTAVAATKPPTKPKKK
jgi:hypothetical protein